jgi:hypothetical protein
MAVGKTITDSLADSLPTVVASARIVRENEGVMPQLVDRATLGQGTGISWNEVSLAQLTATAVTESTTLDNPQQLSDTLLTITPTSTAIHTLITDRVAVRISANSYAKTGSLAQNGIQRKKDEDGIASFAGATTTLCGTGTTLASGHINAGVVRISSNATEPGNPPYYAVLHGYQIKDIQDELIAGVGTYPIDAGITARVFREGFKGMVGGAQVVEAGNITLTSTPDARGGVFAREAIVLVQGRMPRAEVRREPHIGAGATSVFHYDEYAYGERSAGNWLFGVLSDATAPTS